MSVRIGCRVLSYLSVRQNRLSDPVIYPCMSVGCHIPPESVQSMLPSRLSEAQSLPEPSASAPARVWVELPALLLSLVEAPRCSGALWRPLALSARRSGVEACFSRRFVEAAGGSCDVIYNNLAAGAAGAASRLAPRWRRRGGGAYHTALCCPDID